MLQAGKGPLPEAGRLPIARIATGRDFSVATRQLFGNVRLEFPEGEDAARRLVSIPLGDCRLSQLRAGVHTVHGESVAARSDDPDAVKLIIQTQGRSEIEQNGTYTPILSNRPILYDPTRSYCLVNRTPVRLLMLQVPRRYFSQIALRRLNVPFLPDEGKSGLTRILLTMMRSTMAQSGEMTGATCSSVGSAMTELVQALVRGEPALGEAPPRSLDALLSRVKRFIDDNLSRPDLSIALIARRMGCSSRYVFRAFELEGATPADYVWSQRIEKASVQLRTASMETSSISDIAFSLGFSSTAHFSRSFRARFGMAPRDWRRSA